MKKIFYLFIFVSFLSLISCTKKTTNVSSTAKSEKTSYAAVFNLPEEFIVDYENFMRKGRDYELSGSYVYALGCFYDAFDSQDANEEEKTKAMEEFKRIDNMLKDGEFLLEEKTSFGVHDAQEKLKLEAYRYFTEYCPVNFEFSNLEKEDVNYEARTADYKFTFNCENSKKFHAIYKSLRSCFKNLSYRETDLSFNEKDFDNISV